ncbi:uncharacterized protein LOC104871008 isoform X1 [Fukomys damarensis]|uniref:uncharacterized protein LOC104871008 isoform X1 n=1 Tax=Fukomys damarensis TaxID=885580 RepID=UPI00053FB82B|nr:uncharacterized protein LOC104871008 isoform X1 [Fukomys damarensis]
MSVMNLPLVFRTVSAMLSSCRRKKASSTSSCPSAYVYDLGRLAAREGNEGQIGQAQTLRKRKWDTKLCTLSFHPIHTAATQTFVFIILNCSRLQVNPICLSFLPFMLHTATKIIFLNHRCDESPGFLRSIQQSALSCRLNSRYAPKFIWPGMVPTFLYTTLPTHASPIAVPRTHGRVSRVFVSFLILFFPSGASALSVSVPGPCHPRRTSCNCTRKPWPVPPHCCPAQPHADEELFPCCSYNKHIVVVSLL